MNDPKHDAAWHGTELRTEHPVGTILRGTETYPGGSNTKTIRITYVSAQTILAVDTETGIESTWTLDARPWEVVTR